MLCICLLAIILILLLLIHRDEYFSEREVNPGYAFKRLLSVQPRSVFDCAKNIDQQSEGSFAQLVTCQQNPSRQVMIKNIA